MMQTKLFTLYLLLMLGLQLPSQTTYDYLSRPGLTLAAEHYNWVDGTQNNTYRFVGDTLLCGENLLIYQHVYAPSARFFLRVEEGKVWRKSNSLAPCDNELLIYDFDLEVGEVADTYYHNGYQVIEIGTLTLLNGEERKQLFLMDNTNGEPAVWVDGIGDLRYGLFPMLDFEGYTSLICVKENEETIWLDPGQPTELCDSLACPRPVPDFDFAADLLQVNFENRSFNASYVHWDFGDGETSTELHPSHHYANPGCYEVTLTLSTDCLSGTFEKQLSVPVCIAQEWKVKNPDFASGSTKVDFVNDTMGWAITLHQIWKTEDRGVTWTEQPYPIPPTPINRVLRTIDMVDEMHGVIATFNAGAPSSIKAILITHDGGQTWEEKMPGSYFVFSAIMTDDGQVFGTGQFAGVFYSNDWGNSFVELPSGAVDFSIFQYLGNNVVVASGLQGLPPIATSVISISDDAGQSWTHNLLPAPYYRASGFHFFNPNEGFVCGYEGFLIKTEDGGQSWQEIAYDDDRKAIAIHFVDAQNGWAVGDKGLVLSTTDGGDTWLVGNCGYRNNLLSISAFDAENCWAGSGNGKYLEFDAEAESDCFPNNIKELNVGDNKLSIFPNPTSDLVTIRVTNFDATNGNDRVVVYNHLGQNVFEANMFNETLELNTKAWNAGMYWVKWFRNERFIGAEKLMVLDGY